MIHFGSYKRGRHRSIRGIYAWMSSAKNVASLVSRVLRIDHDPHEFPLVKTRRLQEDNAFTDKRRKGRPNFLFWGVELLLAVGFDRAKRYVESWVASPRSNSRCSRMEHGEFSAELAQGARIHQDLKVTVEVTDV
jgi:hypothetical protein